jgi:peptidoglycan/LPS O-acetylase OafA/YrhL
VLVRDVRAGTNIAGVLRAARRASDGDALRQEVEVEAALPLDGRFVVEDKLGRPGMTDASGTGQSTPSTRFAGIDGLRAYAVLAVIAAHALVPWLHGGGVGVDMFFGISGFLITYLLLGEAAKFRRIDLGRFWLRRILRLYPALLIVVLVVDVLAAVILHFRPNAVFGDALQATFPVLFYFANWMIVGTHTAFLGPFGPLWSLSVEEQFYFVWPLILVFLIRFKRGKALLALVAAVISAAAVVNRFVIFGPGDLYRTFATDFRVDMLLAGVLLAIGFRSGLGSMFRRASTMLAAPAAVYIVAISILVPEFGKPGSATAEQLYYTWGLPLVAISTVTLIAFVVTHQDGRIVRLLSWKPLDYTGRISYGLYLWHYPIMFLIGSAVTIDPNLMLFLGGVATYVAAGLSWRFVEQPLQARFHARFRPGGAVAVPGATPTAARPASD